MKRKMENGLEIGGMEYFEYQLVLKEANEKELRVAIEPDNGGDSHDIQTCTITLYIPSQQPNPIYQPDNNHLPLQQPHCHSQRPTATSIPDPHHHTNNPLRSQLYQSNILFYFLFAKAITMPRVKLYRNTVRGLLEEFGLAGEWERDGGCYRVVVEGDGVWICGQDIADIQQLTHSPLYNTHTHHPYLQSLQTIKSQNSHKASLQLYTTTLKPKLYQVEQHQVQRQYEKIMRTVQSYYRRASCQERLRVEGSQSCGWGWEDLRERIRGELVERLGTEGREMELEDGLDEESKLFMLQNLTDLFHSQYQQAQLQHPPSQPKLTLYRKTIQSITSQIPLDYKCKALLTILLDHLESTTLAAQPEHEHEHELISFSNHNGEIDQLLISASSVDGDQGRTEGSLGFDKGIREVERKADGKKGKEEKEEKENIKMKLPVSSVRSPRNQPPCLQIKKQPPAAKIKPKPTETQPLKSARKGINNTSSHKQLKWRI